MPSFQVRYDHEKCKESPVTIPDFPLYLQFNKNGYHFRATGIIRNIPYQNGQNNTYHTEVCVGGRFTTALPITSNLRVYGAATYGKGMTSYIEDFHDEPMAFPNPNHLTELDAITVASYYGALKLNYTPRLYSSLTYSYCRRYMPDSTRDIMKYYGSAYKFGQAVSASLIWEFIPHAVCGVEYWYGKRKNLDKNDGHANRIYGMLRYNF